MATLAPHKNHSGIYHPHTKLIVECIINEEAQATPFKPMGISGSLAMTSTNKRYLTIS
jgi:hypothetical protein